uniref:Uncharacterized protein n=1 Tax=Oryza glumipatula TaxID=40148 RepID=A0A0D9ZWY2_9ORYZ
MSITSSFRYIKPKTLLLSCPRAILLLAAPALALSSPFSDLAPPSDILSMSPSTIDFSRRFLNLIVGNRTPGVKSLWCFDLMRQQLFYPATPPPPHKVEEFWQKFRPPGTMTDSMGLPFSCFTFRASALNVNGQSRMDCFPLAGGEVICMDQSGRAFLVDADACQVGTMPSLHKPKSMPLAVFVPNAKADNDYDHDGYGSSLFFEAFIYRKPTISNYTKAWHCHQLPPPPFVREPKHWHSYSSPEISSYAVLGGGSHICLSVNGIGTYYLETASHTWSQVGKWTLPFHGRIDYVPEFNLWFGLSAEARRLAAADLSAMDS